MCIVGLARSAAPCRSTRHRTRPAMTIDECDHFWNGQVDLRGAKYAEAPLRISAVRSCLWQHGRRTVDDVPSARWSAHRVRRHRAPPAAPDLMAERRAAEAIAAIAHVERAVTGESRAMVFIQPQRRGRLKLSAVLLRGFFLTPSSSSCESFTGGASSLRSLAATMHNAGSKWPLNAPISSRCQNGGVAIMMRHVCG